jgi:hypothetical protein
MGLMRVWLVIFLVALSGCTSKDPTKDEAVETPTADAPGPAGVPVTVEANETPDLRWQTHDYLFSVGATIGTGQTAVPSTATHPAELVEAPLSTTFVRVEFRWEGIASNGAQLTLAIGTGTVASLNRVLDVTVGERSLVKMDFDGSEWNQEFIATIAAETSGSIVAEATVEVRSTAFVGGIPPEDWSAF